MSVLKITAREEDGVLQRVVFEFSKRNIAIQDMRYTRDSGRVDIHVTVESDGEAARVANSIRKIFGVLQIDGPGVTGGTEGKSST